jgi:hypothetical protein
MISDSVRATSPSLTWHIVHAVLCKLSIAVGCICRETLAPASSTMSVVSSLLHPVPCTPYQPADRQDYTAPCNPCKAQDNPNHQHDPAATSVQDLLHLQTSKSTDAYADVIRSH